MATSASQVTKKDSPWRGFRTGLWQKEIDVRDFIQQNYTPYDGNEAFLASATERTEAIWEKLNALFLEERKKGVLDISPVPSSITAHAAGWGIARPMKFTTACPSSPRPWVAPCGKLFGSCPRAQPKAYRSATRAYFRRRDRFTSVALQT